MTGVRKVDEFLQPCTVGSFPRTPEEAGIIPIRLKRKIEYKNNHIEQYISTKKIFEALHTLKKTWQSVLPICS